MIIIILISLTFTLLLLLPLIYFFSYLYLSDFFCIFSSFKPSAAQRFKLLFLLHYASSISSLFIDEV